MSTTTIYVAREIITMNPMQATATHVAVRDGRILGVGHLDELAQWGAYSLDTRFAECTLMPGLIEGHCHLKPLTVARPSARLHLCISGGCPTLPAAILLILAGVLNVAPEAGHHLLPTK